MRGGPTRVAALIAGASEPTATGKSSSPRKCVAAQSATPSSAITPRTTDHCWRMVMTRPSSRLLHAPSPQRADLRFRIVSGEHRVAGHEGVGARLPALHDRLAID